MPIVARGGEITLNALFQTGSGAAADGTSVSFTLRDPSSVAIEGPHGIPPVVDEPGIGEYSFTWSVPIGADLGEWTAEWTGLVLGEQVAGFELVEVVLAGSVSTGDYTYDTTTAVGQVRLYIDDRDLTRVSNSVPLEQRSAIFANDEIQVFLDACGGIVLYAAALGLNTIANNRNLLVQSRRLGKTTVDFGQARKDYTSQANELRKRADEQGLGAMAPSLQFAEIAYTDFGLRTIILNTDLRSESLTTL